MSKLSRRRFVASGIAAAGATAFPPLVTEAQAAMVVRSNVASAAGLAMLKKYAQAVKLMKAKPHGDPLSWQFQWYTHAVPSNTTKAAQLLAVYGPNPSPHKALATLMWNTCQAHFSPANEPFFLPWHRMFVCFFEHLIRKVLNDPTFALPYWDYSVPAGFAIPAQFRMQNDPTFGPLFQPNRRSVVNTGQPIFSGIGTASDLSPASALAQANYLPSGAIPGFNQALDQGLHGNVHVFVGGSQNMGAVPFAAEDPIFWMHHCNIDRLWVIWNQTHANPGTAGYLNKSFVFANESGQRVNAVVKDYTTTTKCGYRYDNPAGAGPAIAAAGPSPMAAMVAPATPPGPPTVIASQANTGPITLGTTPARVPLRVTPAAAPQAAPGAPAGAALAPLAARVEALPQNRRVFVVIKDLSAATTPEALYRVYLDLPEGTPDDPINSHYLGSFTFFDAGGHGGDHAGASKPYSFDATNVIANLQARGALKPEHTVTIVPSGQPTEEAKAVVGDISIVEQ
jgi:tyrosinase